MSILAEESGPYTYADYAKWPEQFRCELINGHVHFNGSLVSTVMSCPSFWHQYTSKLLFFQIETFLQNKECIALYAPFDVRLDPRDDDSDLTVVQPDIFVVCDKTKFSDGRCCKGPPDLIIEILSQRNWALDTEVKRELYENAGVKEYLIVDRELVTQYFLENGNYSSIIHRASSDSSQVLIPLVTFPLTLKHTMERSQP